MNFELWLAFVAASLVIGLVPGPGVLSIIGYAVSSGRAVALAAVAGMALGNLGAMTLSLAGAGAVLAASATAFAILKWTGAFYLVALGCLALWNSRSAAQEMLHNHKPIPARLAFFSNVAIGLLHPKTIVFFVAFVPQFIDASRPYWPQAGLLIATFVMVVALTDALYALGASTARRLFATRRARLWMQRAGGGALITAGAATALTRQ